MTKKRVLRFLVVLGIFTPHMNSLCCAAPGNLGITKADILNILLDQEARIKDISYHFRETELTKDRWNSETKNANYDEIYLAVKEDLFHTRKQTFGSSKWDEVAWENEWAADGKIVQMLDIKNQFGSVEKRLPREASIKQSYAHNYLAVTMRSKREPGKPRGNLIGLLEEHSDILKLLDESIVFNGRDTIVLEMPNYARFYLDPKIGFAVVGAESIGQNEFHWINSYFKEIEPGFWLPMHTKTVFTLDENTVETNVEVIYIKANKDLTVEDFRINFPGHVRVLDVALNEFWPTAVGGISEDFLNIATADVVDKDVVKVNHNLAEVSNQQQESIKFSNQKDTSSTEEIQVIPNLLYDKERVDAINDTRLVVLVVICTVALTIFIISMIKLRSRRTVLD